MDAVGNIYRTQSGEDRRYGAGGRIEVADGVHYEHDADGNLVAKTEPNGGRWRYQWNGHGMLREVERPDGVRVQFEYDAFARRTAKRVIGNNGASLRETSFVWDEHLVVHELDSECGTTTWYWEPKTFAPIAEERAGRRTAIVADQLGTPTEMYEEFGQLAWRVQLDSFGMPKTDANDATTEDCAWRLPGQYEDVETGFCYNRFRCYDSECGVYLSQDPLGVLAGFRLYGYVEDSIFQTDPLGLIQTCTIRDLQQSGDLPGHTGVLLADRWVRFGDLYILSTLNNARTIEFGLTPCASA